MIRVTSKSSGKELDKIFLQIEKDIPKLIAGLTEIAQKDNEENVNNSRSFDGSPLKPLSAKYKDWKSKKLGYTDIFKGKELKLIKSIKSETSNEKGRVYISGDRDKIMGYLEDGGRRGFGLGNRLKTKLKKYTDDWLQKNTK